MTAAGMADPARRMAPADVAASGECFELDIDGVKGVFVIKKQADRLWISGAGAVGSRGLTAPGLAVIEAAALQSGCVSVGFQTRRPGLVKLAKKQGYRIRGYIMEKGV